MDNLEYIKSYLTSSLDVKKKLITDQLLIEKIRIVAELIEQMFRRGNKLLIAGNGGSAGDAQHMLPSL